MVLNKESFKQEVENNSGLVLVDFFAPWCGPCQMMLPIVDELINENKNKEVKIGKVNIDENQEIASKYNVMSVPTFAVFKGGRMVDRISGYCAKEDLVRLIDKNLLR